MPARARISPVRGRTTATPPRRAPLAATAARCTSGSIEECTALAGRAIVCASTRAARPQLAAGDAGDALLEDALQAGEADRRVVGVAELAQVRQALGGGGPSVPTIEAATSGISDVRSGPAASALPLRAKIVARRGSCVLRLSFSPAASPGKTSCGDQATRRSSSAPVNSRRSVARIVRKTRVIDGHRHLDDAVLRLVDLAGPDRGRRGDRRRVAVGVGELRQGDRALLVLAELGVHRGVVALRPGRDVALGRGLLDRRPGGERQQQHDDEQRRDDGACKDHQSGRRGPATE